MLILTMALSLIAQPATREAAKTAGVESYLVTKQAGRTDVVLLGRNRQRLGTVRLSPETDRLTMGGHTLTTTTKDTEADTTITVTYDNQSFTATYSSWPTPGWAISGMPDAEARALVMAQGKLLTLVSEIRHDLNIKDALPRRPQDKPTQGPRSVDPGPGTGAGTNNNGGSWYCATQFLCKGLSGRITKGDACYIAQERASECCTNEVCWGCCAFQDCNHLCAIGDFICAAEVHGAWCVEPI